MIERMSIFWVIFVIFLLLTDLAPPENIFDDVLEERETDDGPNDRPSDSKSPYQISRETEEIHRLDIHALG